MLHIFQKSTKRRNEENNDNEFGSEKCVLYSIQIHCKQKHNIIVDKYPIIKIIKMMKS